MGKPVQEISIPVLIEPDEGYYQELVEEQEGSASSAAKRLKQCTSSLHHYVPPRIVVYGLLSLKKLPVNNYQPLYHPHSSGLPSDTTVVGTESKTGTPVSPTALSPTRPLRFSSLTENKETSSSPLTRKRTLGIISYLPTGRPIGPPPFLPTRLATGERLFRGATPHARS